MKKSTNKTNLDLKKEDNNKDNKNIVKKYSKTEREASFEILK